MRRSRCGPRAIAGRAEVVGCHQSSRRHDTPLAVLLRGETDESNFEFSSTPGIRDRCGCHARGGCGLNAGSCGRTTAASSNDRPSVRKQEDWRASTGTTRVHAPRTASQLELARGNGTARAARAIGSTRVGRFKRFGWLTRSIWSVWTRWLKRYGWPEWPAWTKWTTRTQRIPDVIRWHLSCDHARPTDALCYVAGADAAIGHGNRRRNGNDRLGVRKSGGLGCYGLQFERSVQARDLFERL